MSALTDSSTEFIDYLETLSIAEAVDVLALAQGPVDRDVEWLLEQSGSLIHSNPPLAFHLSQVCARAGAEAGQPDVQARAWYQQAQIVADRGETGKALTLIQNARSSWQAFGDELEALRTDLGLIQVLDDLGRHGEALTVGLDLIGGLDRLPSADVCAETVRLLRAHATENLGTTYGLLGRHSEALAAYERAEADYRALDRRPECAPPLAGRGVELLDLGRPREALEALEAAHSIFVETQDRLFEAQCQGDRARAHRQLGEIAPALRLLEHARRTLQELGARAEANRLQLELAQTYLDVGLPTEAQTAAQEAVTALEPAEMPHDLAMSHYILALSRLALGQTEAGTEDLARAAELFKAVNDPQHQARVRLAQVEAARGTSEPEVTLRRLEACIRELREGGWRIPLVHALMQQADLAADEQGIESALTQADHLVRALALPEPTYQLQLRRGRLCRRQGRVDQAEVHLRQAIDELAHVSSMLPDHVLLTGFHAERFAAHAELVDLLLARDHSDDLASAAQLADESKARTLIELLDTAAGVGPDLTAAEPQLSEIYHELSASYLALERTTEQVERQALHHRIKLLQDVVQTLRLRHPQQRPARAGNTHLAPEAAASDHTNDVGPVIAYYEAAGDVVIFVQCYGAVSVRRVGGGMSALHSLLDDLDDQWSRASLAQRLGIGRAQALLSSTQDCLRSLHEMLIAPILDLIPHDTNRIHVVPHSPMGSIPFHALFDGRSYLVQRWAVTVAPTMSSIGSDPAPFSDRAVAVVAVPDDDAPAVLAEARSVVAHLPAATLLVGEEASVQAFVDVAGRAGLLHVACHGVHPDGSPLFARLRLGDRWMTSIEIVRLDLQGALVTLSACVTGRHRRDRESIGLAWAFLAAGAGGVLSSQWAVDDDAAAMLMDELYRQMVDGQAPDLALRAAQLHTAEQFPHPFFWAPFTFTEGAPRPSARRFRTED